jgi:hypothetical protein
MAAFSSALFVPGLARTSMMSYCKCSGPRRVRTMNLAYIPEKACSVDAWQ